VLILNASHGDHKKGIDLPAAGRAAQKKAKQLFFYFTISLFRYLTVPIIRHGGRNAKNAFQFGYVKEQRIPTSRDAKNAQIIPTSRDLKIRLKSHII
jgi:hypothetical protein